MRLSLTLVAFLIALGGLRIAPARAEEPTPASAFATPEAKARARKLFDAGERAYALKKLEKAIQLWRAGYDVSPAPAALYNVAQAFRNLGDCEQADWFYKAFLRESRPEDPARSKAEEAIAACDALIASGGLRRVTVPPLPADELRAIAPETAAAETGVDEAAGADGEEIDGPIDGGHSVYAKTHRGRTRAFFVAGAAGLGVAAAGSGVAIAASGAVLRNVREAEAATGSAAYDVAFGRARNAAHLANAFWGVAAASAAAGATFTILWLASGSRGRGFAFAPVVGPRSAGLLFAARF